MTVKHYYDQRLELKKLVEEILLDYLKNYV